MSMIKSNLYLVKLADNINELMNNNNKIPYIP